MLAAPFVEKRSIDLAGLSPLLTRHVRGVADMMRSRRRGKEMDELLLSPLSIGVAISLPSRDVLPAETDGSH